MRDLRLLLRNHFEQDLWRSSCYFLLSFENLYFVKSDFNGWDKFRHLFSVSEVTTYQFLLISSKSFSLSLRALVCSAGLFVSILIFVTVSVFYHTYKLKLRLFYLIFEESRSLLWATTH